MPSITALIVGAGPSGLTAALELHRCGVSVRVIDRAPHGARHSQALAVQARTLEQCERYGIVDEMIAAGRKTRGARIFGNGSQIAHVTIDDVASKYDYVLFLPQIETERILTEALVRRGIAIERGTVLEALHDGDGGVAAHLRHADGSEERFGTRYVIGCDGIRSTVRDACGIPFAGNRVPEHFSLADVRLDGRDVPQDEIVVHARDGDIVFLARVTDDVWRVLVERHHDAGGEGAPGRTPDLAYIQDAIDTIARIDARASDPTWITDFGITQRRAETYRRRNAFLAGDAAHVHSPVGGQGMNTGMQDVANLAWKIAAVENGAHDALLDTYDEERGKVGRDLLRGTSIALAAMLTDQPVLEAMRDRLASFLTGFAAVRSSLAANISQTSIHYGPSAAVRDDGGDDVMTPGAYAPDLAVRAGDGARTTLHATLTDATPKIVATEATAGASYVIDEPVERRASRGAATVYVVRPDGYVGYRGRADASADRAAYLAAIGQ